MLSLKSGVVGKTQRPRKKLYLIGEENTNKAGNTLIKFLLLYSFGEVDIVPGP